MDWILVRLILLFFNVINASARLPTSFATSKDKDALFDSAFPLLRLVSIKNLVKFFLCVSIRLSRISKPNFFAACSLAIAAVSRYLSSLTRFAESAVSSLSRISIFRNPCRYSAHWRIAIGWDSIVLISFNFTPGSASKCMWMGR